MLQINRIKNKLQFLSGRDGRLTLFGAKKHQYKLNPPLSIDKIQTFEQANNIKLPMEYVQFMTEVGNGGAGPFYGLEPLENALYGDLDFKSPDFLLTPSKAFPYTSAWNMKFTPTADEESEEYNIQLNNFEIEYFDNKHIPGVIFICNFGCAVRLNLVVNGDEYGNIWTDDRASDQGIYPSQELGNTARITFLDWYEKWLDNSLSEINHAKNKWKI